MKDHFIKFIVSLLSMFVSTTLCWYIYNQLVFNLVKITISYSNWLGILMILNTISSLIFHLRTKHESKRS